MTEYLAEPSQADIDAWIERYHAVERHDIAGIPFYVRPLSRGEFRLARKLGGEITAVVEDLMCQYAALWPLDYDFADPDKLAGINTTLAAAIMRLSRFTPDTASAEFTRWQEQMYEQSERWIMLILMSFPGLSIEQVERWMPDTFFRHLAMADFRMRTQIEVSTNPIYNPDALVDLMLISKDELKRIQQEVADAKAAEAAQRTEVAQAAQYQAAQYQ